MNRFNEYLEDKKVIIVGPAYYLKGKHQGVYINSFDVIVRVNEPMHAPLTKQDKVDFGYKTNIIYLPPSLTKIFITRQIKSTRGWKGKKTFTNADIMAAYNRWQVRGLEWVVGRNRGEKPANIKFNYLNMDGSWIRKTYNEAKMNIIQTTGVLSIKHLLETDLKSLNVIGFDFYQTGYFYAKNDWKKGRPKIGTKGNPHLKYFKQLVEKEKRLIIDDHLKGILDDN